MKLQGVGDFRDFHLSARNVRLPNKTLLPIHDWGGLWYINDMAAPEPRRRRFHPTPGKLLLVLLAAEGILFLANWFQWIPKGWSVLIAVAAVGVFLIGMLVWFALAHCLRWRFQFSLRSLLVLTVAVAVPCSWLAAEVKTAGEQKEAAEEIGTLGGSVRYDCQKEIKSGVVQCGSVSAEYTVINPESPAPYWLRRMMGYDFFTTVVKVSFLNSQMVTDTDLKKLTKLNQPKYVDLRNTKITKEGVERLQQAFPNCKIDH